MKTDDLEHGHGGDVDGSCAVTRIWPHQPESHAFIVLVVAAAIFFAQSAHRQALARGNGSAPIQSHNMWTSREAATRNPVGEADQAIVNGWRLYRTQRGQEAFNHAMATLRATDRNRPNLAPFKGCFNLRCRLALPKLSRSGWIPAGRLWVSPKQYVLFVHSPRHGGMKRFKRRSRKAMRYFIFHEFHNRTRNTDPYDTISAHRRSVFVPFYMSKPQTDVHGNRFVVVIQVAPHNVASRHATNLGHAGPGLEVANNFGERLKRLQAYAGILTALIVKAAEPRLKVVKHRGSEGLAMMRAYWQRRSAVRRQRSGPKVRLPFVPAAQQLVARATGDLRDLLAIEGLPMVARIAPPKLVTTWASLVAPRPKPVLRPTLRRVLRPSIAPRPIILRPPTPVVRASTSLPTPMPLTMESLIARILGSRAAADRSRNCEIARDPDCPG